MSEPSYEVLAGRYELHRQLANGGTADVFLARDQLLNRPVAIKVLNATLSQDEAFVARLRKEAQVVASLNHQNIVGVFDQGEQDGAPFIVMEYVDGRSLAEILRNEGSLEPDRAASIAIDIAAALDAAHRQGMVHMDVKPGNVLVTSDGQVKLADFGIAKALNEGAETDMTVENGTVLGTATYLSPEQAQGKKVGPRSDVYSLAVVLYEMLTGRAPFIGANAIEIARQHVESAPESIRGMGIEVAQSLEAITLKGLAKNPDHRYPSVRDFASDLKRYLGGAHTLNSGGATGAAASARPVTGRSTPPEDPTMVIPVTTPQDATVGVGVLGASAGAATGLSAAPATPASETPVEAQPIVVRSDDTWKRNVMFFVFFAVLLVLLGFLANSLLDVLNPSNTATDPGTTVPIGAETVEVDNFINLEQDQAELLIEQAGLVPLITAEPNNDVAEGRVFAQDPPAGAIVEEGSTVQITVSEAEGQLEVPSLVDLTREEADLQLARRGFTANAVDVDHPTVPAGTVIRQEPAAGMSAERGSVVFFEVSLGPSERTVPELAGEELTVAIEALFDLDFRTSFVEEPSNEVEAGLVLRTDPPAGSLVRGGEIVTVFQSSGVASTPVPSVLGLLPDTARQQLVASGFEVETEFELAANPNDINRVVGQSPAANIELEEGSVVRIVVGVEEDDLPDDDDDDGATTGDDDGDGATDGGDDGATDGDDDGATDGGDDGATDGDDDGATDGGDDGATDGDGDAAPPDDGATDGDGDATPPDDGGTPGDDGAGADG